MIGQIVNFRYEVLEKVGDGTLFAVYKSRDKALNRLVALKLLRREVASNTAFAEAVKAGYQEASSLSHPGIASVVNADISGSDCFVATEFVHGTNVKERVRRTGSMAVPLALDIVIPVLEALDYAHSVGKLHGDLRASDIIVSPDGHVNVTDFGLSRALMSCPDVAAAYGMRSAHYQAPEIAEGQSPSVKSDLYSVGIILYEMLTGSLPFDGPSAVAVAVKKARTIPEAPRTLNAAIPKSLSDIVMKAIEPDPDARYNCALDMLRDLRAISESLRVGRPVRPAQAAYAPGESRYVDEEVRAPDSLKKSFLLYLGVFVAVVAIFLLGTIFFLGGKGRAEVPDVLGMTWDEASAVVERGKFTLVNDGRGYSETYEAGKICSQTPQGGEMVARNNMEIKVKISDGSSRVAVPDLVGLAEADATQLAGQEGFLVGEVTYANSDSVPVNSVISQSPRGGYRRPPGSSINIVLSNGPKPTGDTPTEPGTTSSTGTSDVAPAARQFEIEADIPSDAGASENVKIIVDDVNGQTVAHDEDHQPGEKVRVTVTGYGRPVRIRVFRDGRLVKDTKQ